MGIIINLAANELMSGTDWKSTMGKQLLDLLEKDFLLVRVQCQ